MNELTLKIPATKALAVLNEAKKISKQATDLVSADTIRTGYLRSGKPAQLGFVNLAKMTERSMKKILPSYDCTNAFHQYIKARVKLAMAQLLEAKFRAREEGTPFDQDLIRQQLLNHIMETVDNEVGLFISNGGNDDKHW